jgi:hypothetical protein
MEHPSLPAQPHRGGCLCGAVRYLYDARPRALIACHCRDCQKITGATNLLTLMGDAAAFIHERGELARFRKRADSGREADYVRCAKCGVRVWHEPLAAPQFCFIAAGTLDDPSWVVPAAHIWASRAAPSALIPEGVYACPGPPAADRSDLFVAFERVYGSGGS